MTDPVLALLDAWRRASSDERASRFQRARTKTHGLFEGADDCAGGARIRPQADAREAVAAAVAEAAAGVPAICLVNNDSKSDLASALMAAAGASLHAACVLVIIDRTEDLQSGIAPDCRTCSRIAELPVFEIADPSGFPQAWRDARALSEEFVCPVILRFISAPTLEWEIGPPLPLREERDLSAAMSSATIKGARWVPSAAMASTRGTARMRELCNLADASPMNSLERRPHRRIGYVVPDYAYPLVRARHPEATILRLGLSYPFPMKPIRGIVAICGTVVVVEAGRPLMAEEMAAEGLSVLSAVLVFGAGKKTGATDRL